MPSDRGSSWRTGAGVGLVVFCVLILLLSSLLAGVPLQRQKAHPAPDLTNLDRPANATTYYPYLVDSRRYPSPDAAVSLSTPIGLPRLAVNAGGPTGASLVYVTNATGTGNNGALVFRSSAFNATYAGAILNQSACVTGSGSTCLHTPNLPLQWAKPVTIASGLKTPVTGDAIATFGADVVAAMTSAGTTNVYFSSTAGTGWTSLGSVSGGSPNLAVGQSWAVLTTLTSAGLIASTFPLSGAKGTSVTLSTALNASPVVVPELYSQGIGILASSAQSDQLTYYSSASAGSSYTSTTIGAVNASTNRSIFSNPSSVTHSFPGTPGELALIAEGGHLFALYTTSYFGHVVAASIESPDEGVDWQGPYFTPPLQGSLDQPQLSGSPTGYIYATWREGVGGSWQVDQAIYSPDGRILQNPTPVSGTGGGTNASATGPSVAVDAFQRPLFAWQTNPSSKTYTVQVTGAYLSASRVVQVLKSAVGQLVPSDISTPTSTALSTFQKAEFSALGNLSTVLQSSTGVYCQSRSVTGVEVYPNATSFSPPTSAGSCGALTAPTPKVAAETGPFAANTYLGIYGDWQLQSEGYAGISSPFSSASQWYYRIPSPPPPPLPVNISRYDSTSNSWLSIHPITLNPTIAWLNTSGSSFGYFGKSARVPCPPGQTGQMIIVTTDQVTSTAAKISVNGLSSQTFTGTTSLPSVYLTGLTPGQNYTWSATYSASYTGTQTVTGCGSDSTSSINPADYGWPTSASWPTQTGKLSTFLAPVPNPPTIVNNAHTATTLNYNWENSVDAKSSVYLNESSPSVYSFTPQTSNGNYVIWDGAAFSSVSNGYYTTQGVLLSPPYAGVNPNPNYAVGGTLTSSPALKSTFGCTFQKATNPVLIWGATATEVSNVTTTKVQLVWYSNVNGAAWVNYFEDGTGLNYTVTAVMSRVTMLHLGLSFNYQYTAEIEGLSPFAVYPMAMYVDYVQSDSCLVYQNDTTTIVVTPAVVSLGESDLLYNSVTHQGGGAILSWTIPYAFYRSATFRNGTIFYGMPGDSSSEVVTPLQDVNVGGWEWQQPLTLSVEITPKKFNTTYFATIWMNYTVTTTWGYLNTSAWVNLTTVPMTFVYQKESTSDGLTDLEKGVGWSVPTWPTLNALPNCYGYPCVPTAGWVFASAKYATNGLVSDFLEKAYQLNPTAIDSAGSGMLDTWNLTFDLGTSYAYCPMGLKCWGETNPNQKYNPFAFPPAPGVPAPKAELPVNTNPSTLEDNSPTDAERLWSTSQLNSFLSLIQPETSLGWLRGVIGTDPVYHHWTVTVWGKLSWSADPLTSSTPGDGIIDGNRINPVHEVALEVDFATIYSAYGQTNGYAYVTQGLSQGVQFALNFTIASQGASHNEYTGFSQANTTGSQIPSTILTIPVDNTQQFQTITIRLLANESTGSHPLTPLPINQSATFVTITEDMLNATPTATVGYTSHGVPLTFPYFQFAGNDGTVFADLGFGITSVADGGKAPTYLWVPQGNATLSSQPWGLRQYTAEQNFVLVVVNASYSESVSVENFWTPTASCSGSPTSCYTVSVTPGLNNFLLPRWAFLGSPLGAALLNNTALPYSVSGTPPIYSGASSLLTAGYTNPLKNLECYWQNRAVSGNPSLCPSTFGGTSSGSPSQIDLVADQTSDTGCSLGCGGVPSDPGTQGGVSSPALATIVTLNVSSAAELAALAAAILDNNTGGLNGTLLGITPYVTTLHFLPAVSNGLANTVQPNTATYPGPIYYQPPPPPPPSPPPSSCSGFLGCAGQLFNSVAGAIVGAVSAVVNTVVTIATDVWNAVQQAAQYLNQLAQQAGQWAATAVNRAVSALKAVANLIVKAIEAVLQFIYNLLVQLLKPVWQPIQQAISTWAIDLRTSLGQAYYDTTGTAPAFTPYSSAPTVADAIQFFTVIGQALLVASLFVGIIMAMIYICTSVSFGIGILMGIVIAVIIQVAATEIAGLGFQSLGSFTQPSSGMATIGQNVANGHNAPSLAINWTVIGDLFGLWASAAAGLAATLLGIAVSADTGFDLLTGAGLVFSLVAVILAWFLTTTPKGSPAYGLLEDFAMADDVLSLWVDFAATKNDLNPADDEDPGASLFCDGLSFGLDLTATYEDLNQI